jgi:hypothetical protein
VAEALGGIEGVAAHEVAETPAGHGAADVLVVLTLAEGSDPDSGAVRAVAALEGSAELAGLCPGGVAVALVGPA